VHKNLATGLQRAPLAGLEAGSRGLNGQTEI
jgi:hypothetical protein